MRARPNGSRQPRRSPPTAASDSQRHRVVVVGGGFGGLQAVRKLRRAPVDITLVDRRNFHLFQPLVYQVATGALSPGEVAAPLRGVFKRDRNVRVLLGEVTGFDLAGRRVFLDRLPNGGEQRAIPYDSLIVAAGSSYSYFGHEEWRPFAPDIKSLEGALEVRRRILTAFEAAEVEPDPGPRSAWLTFVVVGGGPTGVELAGQIAEIARDTLRRDFRTIDTRAARIQLVEMAERVLPMFPPRLSERAARALERLGVTPLVGRKVVGIDEESVTIAAEEVAVGPDLALPGHPEVMALGDMVQVHDAEGNPVALPGLAPVAMQQGRYAARAVRARLGGSQPPPFRYRDKGNLATIGRAKAVADIKGLQLSGLLAWLTWLFVHLFYLIGLQNRLLVFIRWTFSFVTRGRGARLITSR